ncbi:MAG: hypothetical protein ABI668_05065 [Sphingorhabdus sp.]
MKKWMLAAAMAAALAAPVMAGWKVMPKGTSVAVAKSSMTVTPAEDWNRWSARPSKKGEIWTLDGISLNELSFFAQIASGEPLYRERDKKNLPLPKFKSDMLPTDLVELFEASNRIVLQTSLFEVSNVEPTKLGGNDAVRFSYRYVVQGDELNRKGEAVAANIGGKLYLVNFVAPSIHYYDRDVSKFRALVDSIRI